MSELEFSGGPNLVIASKQIGMKEKFPLSLNPEIPSTNTESRNDTTNW